MKEYKKGTKVLIETGSNQYSGCDGIEEITLEKDYSEEELEQLSYEMAVQNIEPYGSFRVI